MKTKYLFVFVVVAFANISAFSTTFIIQNVGTTFSPKTITIEEGDVVSFQLSPSHDAVEVSKTTYDANGNTKNGGFEVPFGGGQVTFPKAGTYYYVCEPHAGIGMKGFITVTAKTVTAVFPSASNGLNLFSIYPNPALDNVSLRFNADVSSIVTVDLYDITGRRVQQLFSGKLDAGENTKFVTLVSNLSSGKYLVKYSGVNVSVVKPLLIYRE